MRSTFAVVATLFCFATLAACASSPPAPAAQPMPSESSAAPSEPPAPEPASAEEPTPVEPETPPAETVTEPVAEAAPAPPECTTPRDCASKGKPKRGMMWACKEEMCAEVKRAVKKK